MQIAFFHWGFHIWAIYGLVGLSMAYFAFRHGLPLSMRSTLYPLIGDKIYGPMGHAVDSFAILGTMFGIATSLGLSVAQINAGLNYLWLSIPVNTTVQIIAIVAITCLATLSVVAGMDKGVKRLSILNIGLAVALMVFVFAVGPTIFILNTFMENTGSYLSNIVERTFSLRRTQAVIGLVTGRYLSSAGLSLGRLLLAYLLPKSAVAGLSVSLWWVSCWCRLSLPSYGSPCLAIQHCT